MSLVGELEFRTVIDDKPAIIIMPNACLLDVEVSLEKGFKEAIFTIEKRMIDEDGKTIFTIEPPNKTEEEEH